MRLRVKKNKQEGDLVWEYRPLQNMISSGEENKNKIVGFDTNEISVGINNPLNIEAQPSYDGTVNLIINDDVNPPRIINSRFSKIENNRYRIISRNQKEQTNLYRENVIDAQTRLFRNINYIPKVQLSAVSYFGQLMGGTYTFYARYADNDYNKTEIIAESGPIAIFNGTLGNPRTICGTLQNERTDKSIKLHIDNIDTSFSKIYLYYTRETSDLTGIRLLDCQEIVEPYNITNESMDITINGFEEINQISSEEINIKYNIVETVKTQTQIQNMLFFGNVTETKSNTVDLQNLSYYIKVKIDNQGSIDSITENYESNLEQNSEYYSPLNLYYKLGYWPDELYRLGIVYIMNDDSLSPVYNLRGCSFDNNRNSNYEFWDNIESHFDAKNYDYPFIRENGEIKRDDDGNNVLNYLPKEDFLDNITLNNTYGVFHTPKYDVINENEIKPIYFKMTFQKEIIDELKKRNVKGFFFTRQKRIPITLCQGLSIGINENCYIPMLPVDDGYVIESFKSVHLPEYITPGHDFGNEYSNILIPNMEINSDNNNFKVSRLITNYVKPGDTKLESQSSALLNLDSIINPTLQGLFDGSEFILEKDKSCIFNKKNDRHYYYKRDYSSINDDSTKSRIVYVPENTPLMAINDYGFCTRAGSAGEVWDVLFTDDTSLSRENNNENHPYYQKWPNQVRGIYCPILGTNSELNKMSIYNIRQSNYNESFIRDYFNIRGKDNSSFYSCSERFNLNEAEWFIDENDQDIETSFDIYRGDCYTNTITIRLNRNFVDPDIAIQDDIVDIDTWKDNYVKWDKAVKIKDDDVEEGVTHWWKVNRADVNAVPLGIWVTFKCMSNYNLGLRSEDSQHYDERAIMGKPRGFYPFGDMSTKSGNKISESKLLNDGYSTSLNRKNNFIYNDLPYIKDQFDNRIMFSNVQQNDAFKNSYRIFQGMSYQDIDRQYGAIVKLIPWKENILCVFEHGIGIVPVNEKALFETTTSQSIHLYGAGVLQSQVSVISADFGSIWQESIIRTPIGVYGVDTNCKKIWQFTEDGLRCISDMRIQRFLNDNITLDELEKYPTISLLNVKTHYNNLKGDVIFTFYDYKHEKEWSLCYNERMSKWITQYTWTPVYSENINNIFCSMNREAAEMYAFMDILKNNKYGLKSNENEDFTYDLLDDYSPQFRLVGNELTTTFEWKINYIEGWTIGNNGELIKDIRKKEFNEFNYIDNPISISREIFNPESKDYKFVYINIDVRPYYIESNNEKINFNTINQMLVLRANIGENGNYKPFDLNNSIFIHGRSGIFDEFNYLDENQNNQIKPTKWYNKQEPFEYEFVVNGDEIGLHKIFDDLIIISNNVQPKTLEFEIIGDVFHFNKAGIFWSKELENPNKEWEYAKETSDGYKISQQIEPIIGTNDNMMYENRSEIVWDNILNQFSIKTIQPCLSIVKEGRALGNIHYKEDSFFTNIEPISYKEKIKYDNEEPIVSDVKNGRIRDKYVKIRVKYTGEDLAIITALHTMYTLSYN